MTLLCAQSWKADTPGGMENWTVDPTDVEGPYAPGCSSRAAEGFYSGALLGAKRRCESLFRLFHGTCVGTVHEKYHGTYRKVFKQNASLGFHFIFVRFFTRFGLF